MRARRVMAASVLVWIASFSCGGSHYAGHSYKSHPYDVAMLTRVEGTVDWFIHIPRAHAMHIRLLRESGTTIELRAPYYQGQSDHAVTPTDSALSELKPGDRVRGSGIVTLAMNGFREVRVVDITVLPKQK